MATKIFSVPAGPSEMQPANQKESRAISYLAMAGIAAPLLLFYGLLWKSAFSIPMADDYDVILRFVNMASQAPSFLQRIVYAVTMQHNGYKLMFDNAVVLTQFTLLGKVDFLALVAIGDSFALFLFLVVCLMLQVAPRDIGRRLLLLVPVAFLVFQLQYASALNFASCSLQQLPVIFFSFLSILLLTKGPRWSFIAACLSLILAVSSSPNGFIVEVIGIVLLLQMRRWKHIPVWIGTSLIMVALYAFRYQKTASATNLAHGSAGTPTHFNIVYALSFLGSSAARYQSVAPSLTLGVILCVVFAIALRRRYYAKNPAVFYAIVFILINSIAISGLRSDLGLAQSLASRYRMYSNLFLALAYIYIIEDLLPTATNSKKRQTFLVLAAAISMAFCILSDAAGSRFLLSKKQAVTELYAAQWNRQSSSVIDPKLLTNAVLARQADAGIFNVDLPVLQESVRLGVYWPPAEP